ncbi:MAG: hypothetical protein ACRYFU_17915 [Janthinobacterium lividum]
MRRIAFYLLYLSLFRVRSGAQERPHPVSASGETTIKENLSGQKAVVYLRTWAVPVQLTDKGVSFPQCTDSRIPCSLTEKLIVSLNGIPIFMPRSAYADLGDVSTIEMIRRKSSIELLVRGGDASEAYTAKLICKDGKLVARKLYSAEDGTRPLQISHYFK